MHLKILSKDLINLNSIFRPSEDELEKAFAFGHDFAKETLQCVNGGQCNIQNQ